MPTKEVMSLILEVRKLYIFDSFIDKTSFGKKE